MLLLSPAEAEISKQRFSDSQEAIEQTIMLLGKQLDAKAGSQDKTGPAKQLWESQQINKAFYFLHHHPNAPLYHKAEILLQQAASRHHKEVNSALAAFYGDKNSPLLNPKMAADYFLNALKLKEAPACLARANYVRKKAPFTALPQELQKTTIEDLECAAISGDRMLIERLIKTYHYTDSLQARIRIQYWQERLKQLADTL